MYIVIELQTLGEGQVANLVTSYSEQAEAESHYHSVLAAAAVSPLPVHACTMLTETGRELKHEYYAHGTDTDTTE